jgi:hypothetical protein
MPSGNLTSALTGGTVQNENGMQVINGDERLTAILGRPAIQLLKIRGNSMQWKNNAYYFDGAK